MFGFILLGNLRVYVWSITNWTAILYMKYVAMKKGGFRFFSVLFYGMLSGSVCLQIAYSLMERMG